MNEVTESPRILVMISAFVTRCYECPLLPNYDISTIRRLCGQYSDMLGTNGLAMLLLKRLTKTE